MVKPRETAEQRGGEFADFWRLRLEERVDVGVPLELAAEETIDAAVRDFGRLTEGTKGYDFLRALSELAKDMPAGEVLRKWDNGRQVGR